MPSTFFGLPLHPLLVHGTVVFVPLAAVFLVLSLANRRFRAWAGPLPLILAAIAVILTPLSTSSGENLEKMTGGSALIEKHAHYAGFLVYWTIAMFVVAALAWFLPRRGEVGKGVATALLVAGIVAAAGTAVQTALIGHSGAKAAWSDVAQK